MTQNLTDGSTIQHTIHAQIARDKAGRTVRIQELGKFGSLTAAPLGTSADAPAPKLTTIFDPVAKLHIDFTSDSKVAHELVVQTPIDGNNLTTQGGFGLSANMPVAMRGRRIVPMMTTPAIPSQSDPSAEQLGTKTVAGVNVIGTRTKTVIPAGTIGNNSDITIVHETWFSPELRMVMESTQTDPRFGQTTYSVTDLDQSDPDAGLFQVPPGYLRSLSRARESFKPTCPASRGRLKVFGSNLRRPVRPRRRSQETKRSIPRFVAAGSMVSSQSSTTPTSSSA
jgi:hypothetical protein